MSLKWRYLPDVPDCDCMVFAVCADKSGRCYVPNYPIDYSHSGVQLNEKSPVQKGFLAPSVVAWMKIPSPATLGNPKGWSFPCLGDPEPEKNGCHLVTREGNLGSLKVEIGYFDAKRLKWIWGMDGSVIAWRAIPKYKENTK